MKKHIGQRIKEVREAKGFDQITFAQKIGVVERTLRRYEKGEQLPDADVVLKIAALTDIPPHWILTGEGGMYNVETSETKSTKAKSSTFEKVRLIEIPLLSTVPAGKPNLVFHPDYIEKYITVDDVKDPNAFALKVEGNSMSPRIEDGDVIVVSPKKEVRNGDICVVRVNDEDTVKKVNFEDGYVHLIPLNHGFEPVTVRKKDVTFIWRVIKVVKSL